MFSVHRRLKNYTMRSGQKMLVHDGYGVWLLGDHDKNVRHTEIDAMVASGDFFITVATALDSIANSLTADAPRHRPQLEHLVKTLLHMQRHYQIAIKRPPDFRQ